MLSLTSRPSVKIQHFHDEWLEDWCQENGWTDLFCERKNNYWAFPPGAVMPEPIPGKILRNIKSKNGMTQSEKFWSVSAIIGTCVAVISTYLLKCPMPMIVAFAFDAVTAARLELEDI
ncbi:MAG: hypothetical protein KME29_11800 [Calothrix sp. FI2-JRJ7]|jgi:hypothetical protein|nr:hypothetical protein [Calothrix sp. FI2-JRJ7]